MDRRVHARGSSDESGLLPVQTSAKSTYAPHTFATLWGAGHDDKSWLYNSGNAGDLKFK